MTRHPLLPLPVSLVFLASSPLPAAPVLTHLGAGFSPTAISADGTTVCGTSEGGAMVWTFAGGLQVLASPGGYPEWEAHAISADGSVIAGHAGTTSTFQAARWTNGSPAGLGTRPGTLFPGLQPQAFAHGMSANGSVIAGYGTSPSWIQEAFRYSGGSFTGLGVLPGGGFSKALAVSADGTTIVGQSSSFAGEQAFIARQGLPMTALGDLPGGEFRSIAHAVSANGSVVVGTGAVGTGTSAFRWTAATGIQPLALPAGTTGSEAFGVSADGIHVVGQAVNGNTPAAAVWKGNLGGVLLSPLLEDEGIDLHGLLLSRAVAVSANGDVIAGKGLVGGEEHGWVIHQALELLEPNIPLPELVLTKDGASVVIGFDTRPGYFYQVEKAEDHLSGPWQELGPRHSTLAAEEDGEHQVIDPGADEDEAYYRLRVVPAA